MNSLDYLAISIPNLLENPYVVQQVTLNSKLYFFEFSWNIRQGRVYISIYINKDGKNTYLLKNMCLMRNIILSKYIYDKDNWAGDLTFARIIGSDESDYRIDNLHEFFALNYYAPEE